MGGKGLRADNAGASVRGPIEEVDPKKVFAPDKLNVTEDDVSELPEEPVVEVLGGDVD